MCRRTGTKGTLDQELPGRSGLVRRVLVVMGAASTGCQRSDSAGPRPRRNRRRPRASLRRTRRHRPMRPSPRRRATTSPRRQRTRKRGAGRVSGAGLLLGAGLLELGRSGCPLQLGPRPLVQPVRRRALRGAGTALRIRGRRADGIPLGSRLLALGRSQLPLVRRPLGATGLRLQVCYAALRLLGRRLARA